MSNPKPITTDEWLAELQRISQRSDEGLTIEEWRQKLGRSESYVREHLKRARALGWLRVGRRSQPNLAGVMQPVPVYTVEMPQQSS
jgi:hypothetical protein